MEMRAPKFPRSWMNFIRDTYYLYDNGVGIFKKIETRDIFRKGRRITQEGVLLERFLTVMDLPTLQVLRDILLRRD